MGVTLSQRLIIGMLGLVLFAPLLIYVAQVISPEIIRNVDSCQLHGMTRALTPVELSRNSFFSKKYQKYIEDYYKENLGLRCVTIKAFNQLNFSALHSTVSPVVIGSEDNLYQASYINDACGTRPPLSRDQLTKIVSDIEVVQSAFAKRGIDFIFLITPSKALTMPEQIPPRLCPHGLSHDTNYDRIVPLLKMTSIRLVDGQAITLQDTPKDEPPPFPKSGIHWTDMAAFRVTDALIAEINRSPFGHLLPRPKIGSTEIDFVPDWLESDLFKLLNLSTTTYSFPIMRPHVIPVDDSDKRGDLSLAFVGGSFTHGVIKILKNEKVTNINRYYYYNVEKSFWPRHGEFVILPKVDKPGLTGEFLSESVVVLEANVEAIGERYVETFLADTISYFTAER